MTWRYPPFLSLSKAFKIGSPYIDNAFKPLVCYPYELSFPREENSVINKHIYTQVILYTSPKGPFLLVIYRLSYKLNLRGFLYHNSTIYL